MMRAYKRREKILVSSFLIDNRLTMMPSALLCILQEIAGNHANSVNIGWQFLNERHCFWAISKVRLIIQRMPRWNEIITAYTWEKPHDFITQPRDYEIFDAEKNRIIYGTSTWVILDSKSGKPVKMETFNDIMRPQKAFHAIEEKAPKIQKIELPSGLTYKPVLYSDIDMNNHVNNTKYLQWLIDDMGYNFQQTHSLKEIIINYNSQTKCNDYYAIHSEEAAPNDIVSIIVSRDDNREICRIETLWNNR